MFSILSTDIKRYLASYIAVVVETDLERMLVLRTTSKAIKDKIDVKLVRFLISNNAKCVYLFTRHLHDEYTFASLRLSAIFKCSITELKAHCEYMASDEYDAVRDLGMVRKKSMKRKVSRHKTELKKFESLKRKRAKSREDDEDWNEWSLKEIKEQIKIHQQHIEFYTYYIEGFETKVLRFAEFKDQFFTGINVFKWFA